MILYYYRGIIWLVIYQLSQDKLPDYHPTDGRVPNIQLQGGTWETLSERKCNKIYKINQHSSGKNIRIFIRLSTLKVLIHDKC